MKDKNREGSSQITEKKEKRSTGTSPMGQRCNDRIGDDLSFQSEHAHASLMGIRDFEVNAYSHRNTQEANGQ